MDVAALGREGAARVASECGETVQVTVLDGTDVVYIAKVESTHSIRLVSNLGARLPAHCTAGGKMLLSTLSVEALDALYPHDTFPAMTEQSVTTRARLDADLEVYRQRWWSDEYCESNQDAACVASSIHDQSGASVAALSISIPIIRWTDSSRLGFARLAVEGADWISARHGAQARRPAVF